MTRGANAAEGTMVSRVQSGKTASVAIADAEVGLVSPVWITLEVNSGEGERNID